MRPHAQAPDTRAPPAKPHRDDPPAYDYVTVGHVTVDVLADGSRRPGGTAFYSALQAARLGLRTLILHARRALGDRGAAGALPRRARPTVLPAEHTTTLRTSGEGLERHQRLLAWAGPIEGPIEVDTAILHVAPVAREIPRECFGAHPPHAELVGLTPRGSCAQWDAAGDITLGPLAPELLPERCDACGALRARARELRAS